jgi:hypothetical protein
MISPIQPHCQPLQHLLFRLKLGHLEHPEKPLKPATQNKANRTATPHAILLSPLTSHRDFPNVTTPTTHLAPRHRIDARASPRFGSANAPSTHHLITFIRTQWIAQGRILDMLLKLRHGQLGPPPHTQPLRGSMLT